MLNKEDRTFLILDVACPFDTRVNIKEKEKIENLKREIIPIWKCKTVKVAPIIIGVLGTFPKGLEEWLGMIGMSNL